MNHSFNVNVANRYGIPEAILLECIRFWVLQNEANKFNYIEGKYWTFNTAKAFNELFPYLSTDKISRALKHLENEGLILTGNFNKKPMDRTKWYTVTEKAMALLEGRTFCMVLGDDGVQEELPVPEETPVDNGDNSTAPISQNAEKHFAKSSVAFRTSATCISHQCDSNTSYIPVINTVNIPNAVVDNKPKSVAPTATKARLLDYNMQSVKDSLNYWEQNMGSLNMVLVENITELAKEVGFAMFKKAVDKSVKANKRNFFYVQRVARGIAEGDDWDNKAPKAVGYSGALDELYGGKP